MDPVGAIAAGTEAVGLVSAMAKLISDIKAHPNDNTPASLRELLDRLPIEAIRLSRDLENRIRNLVERVGEYGLNPDLPLLTQLNELHWYNIKSRSRLKTFREDCHSIYCQLTSFLDDVTALLLCNGSAQRAASAFKANLETKRKLDSLLIEPDVPLRKLLNTLLRTASEISADLQS